MSKTDECEKVIKLIEKYWKKEDTTETLSYKRYCEMWEEVINPKQYKKDVLEHKLEMKKLNREMNKKKARK